MGFIRPATPGFLVTLAAAALLAVVVFSVPYFKSIFFLKASLESEGISGSIIFGTLGYCVEIPGNTTCSKPSIGYELNINQLVGNNTKLQIPNVVVKWITYAFVLHIVALVLAAVSAVFGLMAHVREFSMTCCSTLFSGGAAAVALVASIFDIAFFFVAKSRINSVKGGSAQIGLGIWLTLAAWLLLFFAGCFYGLGRCCISRRPRDSRKEPSHVDNSYAEQMRLDAIKADADRKLRQQEAGLPAFAETQPLTSKLDGEEWMEDGDNNIVPYRPNQVTSPGGAAGIGAGTAAYGRQHNSPPAAQYTAGGYAQATPGTRAVDDYYNSRPTQQATSSYPPQPRRQASSSTQYTHSSNAYSSTAAPPPIPTDPASNQYLAAGAAAYGGHSQTPSATSQYGHPERGTTYHSAASHQQYPTSYSQYPEAVPAAFNSEAYNATGRIPQANASSYAPRGAQPYTATNTMYTTTSAAYDPYARTSSPPQRVPERNYTLGGDSYPQQPQSQYYTTESSGSLYAPAQDNAHYSVALDHMPSPYSPMPSPHSPTISPAPHIRAQSMHKPPLDLPAAQTHSPSPGPGPGPSEPVAQRLYEQPAYEDSPPVYDDATAQPPGQWGAKR
ncbi:SUR7/PalI family-domain-containing protein [Cytidiella melzeri]|nr:SUR7/PalI family-domain-containing protein [Cytidiella melzeri]